MAEMTGELTDGEDVEDDVAKDALPPLGDDPVAGGRDDAVEGVEEACLSGVNDMDHGGRNSSDKLELSIEPRRGKSRGKATKTE